jgi:spore maturation protein CgeB
LLRLGHNTKWVDPNAFNYSRHKLLFLYQLRKVHSKLANYYLINEQDKYRNLNILNEVKEYNPDIVLSYNESFLSPETVDEIKKISKFVIFLADNPFYSFYKRNFFQVTLNADLVITPDSGCLEQLQATGINNIIYGLLGVDKELFKKVQITSEQKKVYGADVFYLGSIHNVESWAYKRPLMLKTFTDYNLKIFGNRTWKSILPKFPELESHFTLLKKPMSFEELNLRMNCSKIYPVDAHPGIIKGLHARIFDAIAGNILPITEFREDINRVFKEVKPPVYSNFGEMKKHSDFFIKKNNERESLVKELNHYLFENYSSEKCITEIINKL